MAVLWLLAALIKAISKRKPPQDSAGGRWRRAADARPGRAAGPQGGGNAAAMEEEAGSGAGRAHPSAAGGTGPRSNALKPPAARSPFVPIKGGESVMVYERPSGTDSPTRASGRPPARGTEGRGRRRTQGHDDASSSRDSRPRARFRTMIEDLPSMMADPPSRSNRARRVSQIPRETSPVSNPPPSSTTAIRTP